MMGSRVVKLLFLISNLTAQMVGMMPKETSKRPYEEISSMTPQLKKMGEYLGMLFPELKRKIISFALELRLNPKYKLYKKLALGPGVTRMALNADNTRALIASNSEISHIVDIEKENVLSELKGHTSPVVLAVLSADGAIAVTGCWYETVRVWNVLTGELISFFQLNFLMSSLALSADGSRVLIGSYNRKVCSLYNALTRGLINILEVELPVRSVVLSADGKTALIGFSDGRAQVWETDTGKRLQNLLTPFKVTLVALSADGALALTGTDTNKVFVWDVKTGTLLNTLLLDGPPITSVALSKDGKRALTGTHDGNIQVWNTQPLPGKDETSTPLAMLTGHTGPVMTLAFGDNNVIASGSSDSTLIMWEPLKSVILK